MGKDVKEGQDVPIHTGRWQGSGLHGTRRIALVGLLVALALTLSWMDTLILLPVTIHGVRLGLANICVLIALYLLDTRTALLLMLVKVVATALLFGSLFSMVYSGAGSLLAFAGMYLLKRSDKVNIIAISVCAAILHNAGQLCVAALITQTLWIFINLPVFVIAACITGSVTGTVTTTVLRALSK
jgi:heptaprenyl diphosphate synthase